jgi:chaperonin GroEL
MKKIKNKRVIFQPTAYKAMQTGINQMANIVRPTLGPLPRMVVLEHNTKNERPEILDDGGTIARRIVALPNRDQDMGAMFMRHVLWQQHEKAGDGTATTAVLFQSIFNQGVRYITSGGNPMLVRKHLEKGMEIVIDELKGMATRLEGQKKIAEVAESICYDHEMAGILGEVFDFLGEFGHLEIRSGRSRQIEREYVTGTFYKMPLFTAEMIKDRDKLMAYAEDVPVFVSDLDFDDSAQFSPLLRVAGESGIKALAIIANHVSDSAVAFLVSISRNPQKFQAFAVDAPIPEEGQPVILEDIAIQLGAKPFFKAFGSTAERVTFEDLGQARRVWADKEYFGFVNGKGSPQDVRKRIDELKKRYETAKDVEARNKVRVRIGKLLGGSATLWVGGNSDLDIEMRKARLERTVEAMRGALLKGTVPGGGVALLACRPAMQRMAAQSGDEEEKFAYHTLARALEEPARAIIQNAGCDPDVIIDRIDKAGAGQGFDVRAEKIADMAGVGIVDAASVTMSAVHSAFASAALALTVDTLIHHKKPETVFNT